MTVKYELEEIWKKVVLAYFKELFHHFPGETDENHENPPS
jgi:hypothetical protein